MSLEGPPSLVALGCWCRAQPEAWGLSLPEPSSYGNQEGGRTLGGCCLEGRGGERRGEGEGGGRRGSLF